MKTIDIALFVLTGLLQAIGLGQQVRVSVQYVELPHGDLTHLLAASPGNAALHAKVMEMVRANQARIVETSIGVCQSGGKASFESIREEIYPTEIAPPRLPCSIGPLPPGEVFGPKYRSVTAFDTRNTGTILEIEAEVLQGGRFVSLRLLPEIGSRLRLETMMEYRDERGDATLRMPIYETWRANTSLTLRSGEFSLVSVISPKRPRPVPFLDSRILLFARADVLAER